MIVLIEDNFLVDEASLIENGFLVGEAGVVQIDFGGVGCFVDVVEFFKDVNL